MTGPKLQQSGEETGQTIVFCIELYGRKDIAFANFSFSSNKDPVSEIGDLMMWHHCLAARILQRIHAALIFVRFLRMNYLVQGDPDIVSQGDPDIVPGTEQI